MATHGITRGSDVRPTTDQDRRKEIQKIKDYKGLVDFEGIKIKERQYTIETLDLTSKLLKWNPEYYTIWNHRRLILRHQFSQAFKQEQTGKLDNAIAQDNEAVISLIYSDLEFLVPLLRKFPKCYWVWDYRLWLLEESTRLLPAINARKFWQQELVLVGKMLSLDSRNFLGWGYRRTVIAALDSTALQPEGSARSMIEQEFDYTTKMIKSNLSNFSAWHNRSKLIPRLLNEQGADNARRRKFLDEELELIQRALWAGSDDQSLWFYHQHLMCTFDPKYAVDSMAPDLTLEQRSKYVTQEMEKILEMLDGAEDCKWIYQSLINLAVLYRDLNKHWPAQGNPVEEWIDELRRLDPLRAGRWNDLKRRLEDQ